MKKITLLLFAMIIATLPAFAADGLDEKLFESLHGHASFNVVIAVLFVILTGVLISLWLIDRKVTKLLKEVKK